MEFNAVKVRCEVLLRDISLLQADNNTIVIQIAECRTSVPEKDWTVFDNKLQQNEELLLSMSTELDSLENQYFNEFTSYYIDSINQLNTSLELESVNTIV